MTEPSATAAQNPLLDRLDRPVRPAAVAGDQAGAFPPGLRPRLGRPPRRDRRHRRRQGAAQLRQHHRGAGEERARPRPRLQRLLRAGRRRHQRRHRGGRARGLAAARPPLQRDVSQPGALCPHRRPLRAGATALGLNAEQARVLDRYHTRFVRAGGALDQPAQDRLAAINERLASLGTQFGQNVLADEKSYALMLEEGDLAGLPDFARAAARAAARGARRRRQIRHHAGALVVREPSCSSPSRRDLREKIFQAWIKRGENGGATDNRAADRRDGGACAPSGRSCSALRPSPTTGSTIRWPRRRPPRASCSTRSGAARAPRRGPSATRCRR